MVRICVCVVCVPCMHGVFMVLCMDRGGGVGG